MVPIRTAPDLTQLVQVDTGRVLLSGDLGIPETVTGVVLFAHGTGSGRHSPRNRFVASELRRVGLTTLLIDLLTEEEEREERQTGHLRFDIDLLAERLVGATDWLRHDPRTRDHPIGYFGASTGAAAALAAAVQCPEVVVAVVSRGGRPDLAGDNLPQVQAHTLLLVGSRDQAVLELNRQALARMPDTIDKQLVIIPEAGHLFEEPGTLEEVARLAADWFRRYLLPGREIV